jgi:regulator of RNase E activity RraA
MSDLTYHGLPVAKVKLTIGGKTFASGDLVTTPDGDGIVVSADPFAEEEILVRLEGTGAFTWYSFRVVDVKAGEQ